VTVFALWLLNDYFTDFLLIFSDFSVFALLISDRFNKLVD